MKTLQIIFLFAIILFTTIKVDAQLPNCAGVDSNMIFMHSSNTVYRYNPSQPIVSGVNPSVFFTNTSLSQAGLAICYNLNGNAAASPTFYTTNGSAYYYWDGANWIATGHSSATVNIGGGQTTIYGKNGGTGYLSKYTGAGNDVFFANGHPNSGPYDVVADVQDNMYEVDVVNSPGHIYKYNPAGVIIDTYIVLNVPSNSAGPGFALIGNTFYFGINTPNALYSGQLINDTINASSLGNLGVSYGDMASCPSTFNPVVVSPTFTYSTCNGNSMITITSPFSSTNATYYWNFGDPSSGVNNTSTVKNATHFYNNDGTYTVTTIVTDSLGSDTIYNTIIVNTTIYNNITMQICSPNTFQGYSTTGIYIDTFATTTGCDSIQTLNLTVNPTKSITIDTTICFGESAYGYTTSGNYSDLFFTTKGCDSTRILNLTVLAKIETNLTATICQGDNYLGYNQTGIYTDHYTSAFGCDSTRIINLTVLPNPTVQIEFASKEICKNDTILLHGVGADSYQWFINAEATPSSTANDYNLQVKNVEYVFLVGTDNNNCSNSTFATFQYVPCCGHVFIPNAFTPNNDHLNDVFNVKTERDIESYKLEIYNRYGQQLFETDNLQLGWNGTFKGKEMEMDTYFYIIYLKCKEPKILKGDFILIR